MFCVALVFSNKIETLKYNENLPTAEAIKVLMDMFHMRAQFSCSFLCMCLFSTNTNGDNV